VQREDVAVKRPGYGIPVYELDVLLGRQVATDVEADEILQWAMFR
jgi:sialic acid synthase SpsE